jgi:hypothetical protein
MNMRTNLTEALPSVLDQFDGQNAEVIRQAATIAVLENLVTEILAGRIGVKMGYDKAGDIMAYWGTVNDEVVGGPHPTTIEAAKAALAAAKRKRS